MTVIGTLSGTLPARGEGRLGRDVDRLPRVRPDARAPGGDQADAPRHLQRPRPARALPPRGARRRAAQPPARGHGHRRRRGRRHPLHRLRVRRGRDAQGPHPPPGTPARGRGGGLRDRDRPRARVRPRTPARAPRREAPERADRPRRARQGHRLRHRPLARGPGADRHRARARHHRLRLARAGARPRGDRAVRHLLARHRASTRCSPARCRSRPTPRWRWR